MIRSTTTTKELFFGKVDLLRQNILMIYFLHLFLLLLPILLTKELTYFNYLDSDPQQETDWVNFVGYSAKGGANYNIDEHNNVFANIGYFEKAPFFNAVFLNNQNIINVRAKNQKIFSAELGYGYRSTKFRANVNV